MKRAYPSIGLAKLCRWFGITRQAVYYHQRQAIDVSIQEELIVKQVIQIRKRHSKIGTRKLYQMLQPFFEEHQIKIGRDRLFRVLREYQLLVKKHQRRVFTTQSYHWLRKYPNLVRELKLQQSNQLWVSDITYWKIATGYVYISLITDAFSRKIVGYHLANNLEAVESLKALKMALSTIKQDPEVPLIHHSDRGIQYCSKEYVKLLKAFNIAISMTENGDPRENAIAERINGILKQEYLVDQQPKGILRAKEVLKQSVQLYNNERPHSSISNFTPTDVHLLNLKTEKLWKNYYKQPKALNVKTGQDELNDCNGISGF